MIEGVETLHGQRARQWFWRLRGALYAALLCTDGPVPDARWAAVRSFAGPAPRRSALGPLVVAGHGLGRAVLEALPAEPLLLDRAPHADGAWFDRAADAAQPWAATVREHADRLAAASVAGAGPRVDLVDLTVRTAAAVIAEGAGLSAAQCDLLVRLAPAAAAAVDALRCPPRSADRRAAEGGTPALRPPPSVHAARAAVTGRITRAPAVLPPGRPAGCAAQPNAQAGP